MHLQRWATQLSSQGVLAEGKPHGGATPHLGELDAPLLSVFQHAILLDCVQGGIGGRASQNAAAICAALRRQQRCTLLHVRQLVGEPAERHCQHGAHSQAATEGMQTAGDSAA